MLVRKVQYCFYFFKCHSSEIPDRSLTPAPAPLILWEAPGCVGALSDCSSREEPCFPSTLHPDYSTSVLMWGLWGCSCLLVGLCCGPRADQPKATRPRQPLCLPGQNCTTTRLLQCLLLSPLDSPPTPTWWERATIAGILQFTFVFLF